MTWRLGGQNIASEVSYDAETIQSLLGHFLNCKQSNCMYTVHIVCTKSLAECFLAIVNRADVCYTTSRVYVGRALLSGKDY